MGRSVLDRIWRLFDQWPDAEATALELSGEMYCSYSTARTALRKLYLDGQLTRRATKPANGDGVRGLEYHYKRKAV